MFAEMIFEQIEVSYLVKCTKCDIHSDANCSDFLQNQINYNPVQEQPGFLGYF